MKKTTLFFLVCCTMLLSSCHRPQEFYNATISEYHFGSNSNQTCVVAILGTINNFWDGDFAYPGLTADLSDVKAILRFKESITAIMLHANDLKPYFESSDNFIYTLKRTTEEEVILRQVKFFLDVDGSLQYETIFGSDTPEVE